MIFLWGGGQLSKDSACGLESAIASSRGVDRPSVLSSLRDSQSPDSSSTILESKSIDKNQAQALESTFSKVDSSVDCHAANAARNDRANNATNKKVDSSTATTLSEQAKDSQNTTTLSEPQKDSRICENTPALTTPQAAGFADDFLKKPAAASPCNAIAGFGGFQGSGKDAYLAYVTAATAVESTKSAATPTPTPNDSKNCGGAGVALHTFGGRSYLGGNDYPPNVCNQSHCSPKAESPKGKVVAIDSIYTTLTPTTTYPNITLESSLDSALAHYAFDLFFASDVLHHLSPDFTQKLLESIAHIPIIIIKDIDSRHIVGHYANALHDLVFNQEKVCKVYPNKLESTLQALGYTTRYHYLPKLWYPHFLLLAYKAAT